MKSDVSAHDLTELTPEEAIAVSGGMFFGMFPAIVGLAALIIVIVGAA